MRYLVTILSGLFFGFAGMASAQGKPTDGALGFQEPVTQIARRGFAFHDNFLLWMCILITIFVALLLLFVMVRFNAKANPVPSTTTHNTAIEIVWTLFPVAILILISIVSFPLLYYVDAEPDLAKIASGEVDASAEERAAAADGWITVKAQGNQWNWTYSYPDEVDGDGFPLEFTSNPLHYGLSTDPDIGERYLSVDYPLVVPAGRYVRYYTAASDVIHSFAMPSFGIKTDAVPGRLNEGWFKVDEIGVYYGQCSELCGKNHAFMPIEIRVVSQQDYDAWLDLMRSGDFDAAAGLFVKIDTDQQFARLPAAD